MKKILFLFLGICASNSLYSSDLNEGEAVRHDAVLKSARTPMTAEEAITVTDSVFERFMANWQANPKFKNVDKDHDFGEGIIRPGFGSIVARSTSLLLEHEDGSKVDAGVTAPCGFFTEDVIDVVWCIKYAHTGSFVVLQKFNELARHTFSNDQKKIMGLLIAIHEHQESISAYISDKLKEKALSKKLCGTKEQKNFMISIFTDIKLGESCSNNIITNYMAYQIYMFFERYEILDSLMNTFEINCRNNHYFLMAAVLKQINMPKAKANYAALLQDKKIHTTWDGVDVCNDDDARYQECAHLYKEEGMPKAKANYAILLQGKEIHTSWNGSDVRKDDIARYAECARLYKQAGIPKAKSNYAALLQGKEIHNTWNGVDVRKDDIARYQECASLYKEAGVPEAKANYAMLLQDKKIHNSWNGVDVCNDDDARYQECARLYKEEGMPNSKNDYAVLLQDKKIHNSWNGVDVRNDDDLRYQECARLYKESGISDSKNNYAMLLQDKKIHNSWNGVDVFNDDDARYQECARLHKEESMPNSKNNYALLLHAKKIHITWNGIDVRNDNDGRYQECARLCKEAGVPNSKNNYAVLLQDKKIHNTWNGVDVFNDDDARYQECARLYKQAGIPQAKYTYALLICLNQIHKTWDDKVINDDRQRYLHALHLFNDINDIDHNAYEYLYYFKLSVYEELLSLYFPDEEKKDYYDEACNIYQDALAQGEDVSKFSEMFSANKEEESLRQDDDTLSDTDDSGDHHQSTPEATDGMPASDNIFNEGPKLKSSEGALARQARKRRREQSRQALELRLSQQDEMTQAYASVEQTRNREEAWKYHCARPAKKRQGVSGAFQKKVDELLQVNHSGGGQHKYMIYSVVNLRGKPFTCAANSKIQQLLNDIRRGGNMGQPHALSARCKGGAKLIARKISNGDRLVYYFDHKEKHIVVVRSEGHY